MNHPVASLAHQLAEQWEKEAKAYERDGQPGAAILRRVAEQVVKKAQEWLTKEPLTLREASIESGFTETHLQRLIHDGKLENVGEPRSPRVLRQDLPRKPGYRLIPDPDPIGEAARARR